MARRVLIFISVSMSILSLKLRHTMIGAGNPEPAEVIFTPQNLVENE